MLCDGQKYTGQVIIALKKKNRKNKTGMGILTPKSGDLKQENCHDFEGSLLT